MNTIKCITLYQPWASLIAIGAKRIETRGWPTNYRGELLIHAAKSPTPRMLTEASRYAALAFDRAAVNERDLPLGKIIAICRLTRCLRMSEFQMSDQIGVSPLPPDPERQFGVYSPGRFAWILENIRPLRCSIAYRGQQGLFNVPAELVTGQIGDVIAGETAVAR